MRARILYVTMILLTLASCGSKRKVTEYVAVHDTMWVSKKDTVRVEVIKTKTDTLREVTVREVTLMRDTAGKTDTVKIETVSDHYRYVYEGDSSSVYRVAVDSILRALDKQHDKDTVKTVPAVDWWQYIAFSVIILGACIVAMKHR